MREIPTFYDAIMAVERVSRLRGSGIAIEDSRSAVLDAYEEISERHDWAYNKKRHRVNIEAPQTDGTIAYSSSDYTVTLTGSTWPSDVIDWVIVISNVVYEIASRTSSTVIVLESTQAPTSDVDSGTSYELYRRYYTLPEDFVSAFDPMPEFTSTILGRYVPMETILSQYRYQPDSGYSSIWSIGPIPDVYGRYGLFVHPANATAETVDIWYRSMPRALHYGGKETNSTTGSITLVADSAAVTGTSTAFQSDMVGSILRIGSNTTHAPTGRAGQRPWAEQRSILTYTSATSVTMDAVAGSSRSTVKYVITDPLDLDSCVIPALYKMAQRNLSRVIGGKNLPADERAAEQALLAARGASNRANKRMRVAGETLTTVVRPGDGTFSYDDGGLV